MKRVMSYFKPYIPAFLLVIIILFGQVNLDLELPNILSSIVTQGIQQQGVDSLIPKALSPQTYEMILNGLDPDERDLFSRAYERIEPGTDSKLSEDFTLLETEALYALQDRESLESLEKEGTLARTISSFSPVPIPTIVEEQAALRILGAEYDRLGFSREKRQNRVIYNRGARMLLFTLMSTVLVILTSLLTSRTSAGLSRSLRADLFQKVQNFSQAEMDSFSTASLITRCTNDINQIQQVTAMGMRLIIFAPLMGIGGFIRALGKAPSMSWVIGLAILVLMGFVSVAIALAMPRFALIQKLVDRVNKNARENLSGLDVIRAFNMEDFIKDRFDKSNKELTATNLFVMRVMSMMMPAIGLVMNLMWVIIIWVGAKQIAEASLNVGDMMAFLQYSMQIVMSFMLLTMIFTFLPRAAVSANRIAVVLNKEITIRNPEKPRVWDSASIRGELEFRNMGFRYPGGKENALSGISFTAIPGKTTAIIGSTGSGKTTLVNMVPRLYDITEGELLLDGIPVNQLDLDQLRRSIALVPQKNTLFKGTIDSNIRYGNEEASKELIDKSVSIARAEKILQEKGSDLNGDVAQGGANFSGGQKQRLSIARALASDRQILVFDDSFSALDFKTDRELRKGLIEQCRDKTVIIVAQRISTIMTADQIIVLDEGKITGKGTHDELMKQCATYREIAKSQLNLEETL